MPFAPRTKLQEEQDTNQGVNISGGGGANFSSGLPGQDKSQKSSGQYANLQSYLSANQQQAGEMGNKLAQDVETQGSAAQNKINDFSTQKQTVAAYDPNSAINNSSNLTAQQRADYQTQKQTGGYSGPTDLAGVTGFQDAQTQAVKAGQAAKNAGTEIGQQQLLKQSYARPDYSQGQLNLDQVLMKGSESSKNQLQNVSNKYSGLEKLFNDTSLDVGNSINSANAQALANKQSFAPAENAAWNNLINPIQQRADLLNQQNPAQYQNVYNDLSDDLLTNDTMQRLGLSAGQNLYDTDLRSYLTQNQTQLGINDAATSDERSKYSSLAGLFQDPTRSQIGEAGQAINPLNFDKSAFDSDVAAKGAAYQTAYETPRQLGGNFRSVKDIEAGIPTLENLINQYRANITDSQIENNFGYLSQLANAKKIVSDFKNQYGFGRQVSAQQ